MRRARKPLKIEVLKNPREGICHRKGCGKPKTTAHVGAKWCADCKKEIRAEQVRVNSLRYIRKLRGE